MRRRQKSNGVTNLAPRRAARFNLFNLLHQSLIGAKNADMLTVSTSSISGLSSNYLQSLLSSALQGTNSTSNSTGSLLNGISSSSLGQTSDNSNLSPFAQLMSTLQQLQQSNPTQYAQVTEQISTNLQSAAQTAQSEGNTSEANQLSQLSTDFSNASQNGQLPNIQDLAQAIGGGGHHHHHHGGGASSSSSSDSSNSQSISQLFADTQTSGSQSSSLNPMAIIMNTLSSAGITTSSNS